MYESYEDEGKGKQGIGVAATCSTGFRSTVVGPTAGDELPRHRHATPRDRRSCDPLDGLEMGIGWGRVSKQRRISDANQRPPKITRIDSMPTNETRFLGGARFFWGVLVRLQTRAAARGRARPRAQYES